MQESHNAPGHHHDQARGRRLVAEEPPEINYVLERLAEQFPKQDHADLRRIILEAKRNIQPSENRDLLMEEARRLVRER